MKLAAHFLPETGAVYGRLSKPKSHWLYTTSLPDEVRKASIQLKDEDAVMIVELRIGGGGKGAQSVMPGSTHTSGEQYRWDADGTTTQIEFSALEAAVMKIAVGTILLRHWPPLGGRHDAALTVGGFLCRAGWAADAVADFVATICFVHGEATDPLAHATTLATVPSVTPQAGRSTACLR
jgi:Bifunctional DNA primase/polymerase, N-terminal